MEMSSILSTMNHFERPVAAMLWLLLIWGVLAFLSLRAWRHRLVLSRAGWFVFFAIGAGVVSSFIAQGYNRVHTRLLLERNIRGADDFLRKVTSTYQHRFKDPVLAKNTRWSRRIYTPATVYDFLFYSAALRGQHDYPLTLGLSRQLATFRHREVPKQSEKGQWFIWVQKELTELYERRIKWHKVNPSTPLPPDAFGIMAAADVPAQRIAQALASIQQAGFRYGALLLMRGYTIQLNQKKLTLLRKTGRYRLRLEGKKRKKLKPVFFVTCPSLQGWRRKGRWVIQLTPESLRVSMHNREVTHKLTSTFRSWHALQKVLTQNKLVQSVHILLGTTASTPAHVLIRNLHFLKKVTSVVPKLCILDKE